MPQYVPRTPTAFRAYGFTPRPPPSEKLAFRVTVDRHHPTLTQLGIAEWLIREFELGYSADLKHLRRRLVFPVRNALGLLVGYAGRWASDPVPDDRPLFRYVGCTATEVFNLHAVVSFSSELPVLIVADPLDLLHLRPHFESVVSLLGEEPNDMQLLRLSFHFRNRQFLVLCDETGRGRRIRRTLVRRLNPYNAVKAPEFLATGRTIRSLTPEEMREEL